jgi:aminoglycoside phosphotransferase (APT) family kinase protein
MDIAEINKYKAKLAQDFPELSIEKVRLIGRGWHHDAVEVNGSLVFRIPRGVHDITSTVENEVAILNALKGKLAVNIPEPLYIAPKSEYFGYTKVEGVLLRDLIKEFNDVDLRNIKQDWVKLASSIHTAISVDEGKLLGLPDFIEPGPSAAERIFNLSGISQDVLEFAAETIKRSKELDMSSIHYVVIHNDLQFHNIMASPETRRITGLIDWTDACVGPLAREFAIGEWMKHGLLEEVVELYEQDTGLKVDIEQARMWRSLEELGDYVESTETGDLDDAKETLERIKNMMSLES